MTTLTILLGLVATATWTWNVGEYFDWWQRAAAHRRRRRDGSYVVRRGTWMTGLTPEAIAEKWLSLTNEQRSELLAQRRKNQLNEKTLDEASAVHDGSVAS